ncbi:hypothetical protein KSF78_0004599 [Schistosoma japonicum]|nr:hypothetical protein KSF78_0004599 [Schistosoma japonicum]
MLLIRNEFVFCTSLYLLYIVHYLHIYEKLVTNMLKENSRDIEMSSPNSFNHLWLNGHHCKLRVIKST